MRTSNERQSVKLALISLLMFLSVFTFGSVFGLSLMAYIKNGHHFHLTYISFFLAFIPAMLVAVSRLPKRYLDSFSVSQLICHTLTIEKVNLYKYMAVLFVVLSVYGLFVTHHGHASYWYSVAYGLLALIFIYKAYKTRSTV